MASNSNPTSVSTQPARRESDIVYQGSLLKRGEHIKNWRTRYFILFRDGALLGYKLPPANSDYSEPYNDFTVKDMQFLKVEQPRPNTFFIRGLKWPEVIERTFCAESSESRDTWLNAMQSVADSLNGVSSGSAAGDAEVMDTETVNVSNLPTAMVPGLPHHESTVKITLEDFTLVKMLGVGSFGKVYLGKERVSGKFYAIKLLKKTVIVDTQEVNHTYTESRVLRKCKHPFLTSMAYSFQTKDRLCFVMDYCIGGDMYHHLRRAKGFRFSINRARFYAAEIACGLGHLHSNHIIYRDIKPENVLLDNDGHIKIADFGLCKELCNGETKTETFCGTPEYVAPEILEGAPYGYAVDWWALGVLVYEMICGRQPFASPNREDLSKQILSSDPQYPKSVTPVSRDYLTGLLKKIPTDRLGYGPDGIKDVKAHPFFAGLDWDKLLRRELTPPFIPDTIDATDTKYFDAEYTCMPVQLTPPEHNNHNLQNQFSQFSFHDDKEDKPAEESVEADGTV